MNEICKQRIRERLVEALKKEGLPTNTAGGILGISPSYLSMMKNPKLWSNVSEALWEKMQKWRNSGLSITAYGSNGGRFVAPENVASEQNVQGDTMLIAEKGNSDKTEGVIPALEEMGGEIATKEEVDWHIPTKIDAAALKEWSEKGKSDPIPAENVSEPGKPVSTEAENRIANDYWFQKSLEYIDKVTKAMEVRITSPANQKIVLDIEINILINGQRVKIG